MVVLLTTTTTTTTSGYTHNADLNSLNSKQSIEYSNVHLTTAHSARSSNAAQELVFIGIGTRLREEAICAALDGCLATPQEMREYEERWEGSETSMAAWMTHEYLRR